MAQADGVVSNASGAIVRADINSQLAAIFTNHSGATEPTTSYAYQWWADTTTGLLKIRNAANSAWVTVGTLADANLGLLSVSGGTLTGALLAVAGSATTPSIAFSGDTNTGIYSPGADQVAISTNATQRLLVEADGDISIDGGSLFYNATSNVLQVGGSNVLLASDIGGTVQGYDADTAKLDVVQTFTAIQTLTDPAIIGAIKEDVYTISDGAAFEIDPSNGSIQLITLGASRTPKATNFAAGEAVTLMVDDGTAYTLTWTDATFGGSGVVWKTDSGSAPTLNTSGYTVIVLWKVGSQVYGARVGDA